MIERLKEITRKEANREEGWGGPNKSDHRVVTGNRKTLVLLKSKVNEKVMQRKEWVNSPGIYRKVSQLTGALGNVSIFSYRHVRMLRATAPWTGEMAFMEPIATTTEACFYPTPFLNPTPSCGMLL